MHNLHLLHIHTETIEDACEEAEGYVSDWHSGTDGVVCGAISQTGETYSTGEGRYNPQAYTLESLQELIQRWVTPKPAYEQAFRAAAIAVLSNRPVADNQLWYDAQTFCERHYELSGVRPEEFDPWKHSFRDSEFDSFGVTHVEKGCESLPQFLVFVDMYS